LNSILTR